MALRVLLVAGVPLGHIAWELARTSGDVDLATWALVGRTPDQALARLNA